MMAILQNIEVHWKDRRLMKTLYNTQQSAYVRVEDWKSEACVIGRSVREAVTDVDIGVKVGGYTVESVRFADFQ